MHRLTGLGLAAALMLGSASLGDSPELAEGLNDVLVWRCIGPSRGGRSTTCCGVPGDPMTYYMGATGGGLWKTSNAGLTWQPITDGQIATGSVGAVMVAPSDPNVIYLGMGERDIRGNFSHGDGMYKSDDAGETWTHIGLGDTRQISKIRVHPNNADIVYVAALGHIFGPNEERGIFRSIDGGSSWEKIQYIDDRTGAIDLAMDPDNPRVLYSGFWPVYRTPWSLESGGTSGGLFKSTDAGDTWTELTNGLPDGLKGKIGVSVSDVDSNRVYAIVEAEEGGVFRSDDAGDSWTRVNDDRSLRQRAWYYSHIYADPNQLDTVYVMNVRFHKSSDGGKSFSTIRVPHADNHDLWINPDNSLNMVNANDGGANVTFDGGKSWTRQDGQPTCQFYRVTVDNGFPYRVYGAQQDNSTVSISSRARLGRRSPFYAVGGGESGYIAVHPDNTDIVYAGSYDGFLTRYDHSTGLSRNITVWPDNPMGHGVENMRYRFQWTFPIVFSPHDADVLYVGSQMVMKSTDEGQSWTAISPDLTTNDLSKQGPSGGPITGDNTSVEYYCTIFTIAESPLEQGVIWAGSDDGLIHITRDNGANWTDVTPPSMPPLSLVSLIDASPHDPGTAWVAATRYKLDDFTPYVYRTTDYGVTWQLITDGIATEDFVRSIREDPVQPGVLYIGTETGVYTSLNAGSTWSRLQLKMPAVPVTDVVVKDNDLVIATQGRSFWILSGLGVLRQLADDDRTDRLRLLQPDTAIHAMGGVNIAYSLPEAGIDEIALEILTSDGDRIKRFTGTRTTDEEASADDDASADGESEADGNSDDDADDEPSIPADAGLQRFSWDGRYPDAVEVPKAVMWSGGTRGPLAPPGRYTARLTAGDEQLETVFTIAPDPRIDATLVDYQEQFSLLIRIRDAVSQIHDGINSIRTIRGQVNDVLTQVNRAGGNDAIEEAAARLKDELRTIEESLIQTKSKSPQDPLNYPIQLNDKIAGLTGVVSRSLGRPTSQSIAVFEDLWSRAQPHLDALDTVVRTYVPSFNELVREQTIPAVVID